MYVKEHLFLHYKQQKDFRVLMKMNAQMYSNSFIAFYMTKLNFFYFFYIWH